MNNKTDIDVQYVSPLKKICMTIGELPSSYLETMSYYEMLVWFTEFLKNQVIPTVNNNAEAVQELQALYEELRTYVNDYFDNLDVQEEINNKLDAMAESGQLTDIIAQYLGLAGMIAFDTVADMKLAQNLVNGSKCRTLGYYSVNDGGGSTYKIRTITNDDTVDEKFILEVYDNNLVAELIIENNEANVACLGLKPQSVQADCSTDLQYILDYASTRNLTIYFPANKTYQIKNPIVLKGRSTNEYLIRGEKSVPKNFFHLFVTECYQAFVGENFPSSGTQVTAYLDGLNIDCAFNNYNVTFFKGIEFYASNIENCNFYHPYIFMEGDLITGSRFTRNRIQSVGFAVFSAICFKNNTIDYATASAIASENNNLNNNEYIINYEFKSNDSCFFTENYIAGNVSKANNLTCLFIVMSGIDTDVYIHDNWFEFFMYAVRPFIKKGTSRNVYGNRWINNEFQNFFRLFEGGSTFNSWIFEGCQFQGFSATTLAGKNMNASSVYNNYKCGVLIDDGTESERAFISYILFKNNLISTCDYGIYIVFPNNTAGYTVRLQESGTKNYALSYDDPSSIIQLAYASNHTSTGAFNSINCETLNNKVYDTLPTIYENGLVKNSYHGQIINVAGTPYMAIDNGTAFQYVQLGSSS